MIRMTPRIDAGGIAATAITAIGPDETAGELEERLANFGSTADRARCRCARDGLDHRRTSGKDKGHKGPEAHARKTE